MKLGVWCVDLSTVMWYEKSGRNV